MLTLNQLRKLVRVPGEDEKVPKIRELQEGEAEIVVREMIGQESSVTVYENGYVLYQDGSRWTTFPFPKEKEYRYQPVIGFHLLTADFLERENWYFAMILYGEDRLAENNERRETRDGAVISYSAYPDGWRILADRRQDVERMIQRLLVEEALALATQRQRQVLFLYYLQEKSHKAIAEELGISRKTVSTVIRQGLERIRRAYGIPTKGVKRDKYNRT